MDLPRTCSSSLDHKAALELVADVLERSGTDLEQHWVGRITLSLRSAGLEDPQRLADAVAFLSSSKLFSAGLF